MIATGRGPTCIEPEEKGPTTNADFGYVSEDTGNDAINFVGKGNKLKYTDIKILASGIWH